MRSSTQRLFFAEATALVVHIFAPVIVGMDQATFYMQRKETVGRR